MPNAASNPKNRLSRRTVIATAAWTTPVLAAVASAPLAAASNEPLIVGLTGFGASRRSTIDAGQVRFEATLGDKPAPATGTVAIHLPGRRRLRIRGDHRITGPGRADYARCGNIQQQRTPDQLVHGPRTHDRHGRLNLRRPGQQQRRLERRGAGRRWTRPLLGPQRRCRAECPWRAAARRRERCQHDVRRRMDLTGGRQQLNRRRRDRRHRNRGVPVVPDGHRRRGPGGREGHRHIRHRDRCRVQRRLQLRTHHGGPLLLGQRDQRHDRQRHPHRRHRRCDGDQHLRCARNQLPTRRRGPLRERYDPPVDQRPHPDDRGRRAHRDRQVEANSGAIIVRTASGDLWTSGAALGFSSGGTAWTRRARNVAAFASWAIRNYVGGLYITSTGTIMQFHASTRIPSISVDYAFRAEAKTGDATGKAITKVFASDGTYLALASDGGVYAWGGNLDNGTRGNPKLVPSDNVIDLNVWGYHPTAGSYYGGGYVIEGTVC